MLIGSLQILSRWLPAVSRAPAGASAPQWIGFVLKKRIGSNINNIMVWGPRLWRALNRLRRHFVSRPGPVWDLGTGSSVLSPRIRSAWNGVYPGCWHHSCLSPLSKSPHDRCWPLKARPRHRQSLIIDLVLGKIGTEELVRIARKVQNSGDLHVRRNIGTNWNIEEEKFHNFIDASGCWWRGRGGALLNWFGILIEKLCPLRAGVSDENWMPLRPIM